MRGSSAWLRLVEHGSASSVRRLETAAKHLVKGQVVSFYGRFQPRSGSRQAPSRSAASAQREYPCQIASDAGEVPVTTVATHEAWVPQVERLVSAYRATGVRNAAFTELHAIELTSRLAQVTVRWTLADGMGRSIYDFEASYSVADHGDGMRIAAIAHNEALPCVLLCCYAPSSPMPSITDAAPSTSPPHGTR